jgi:PAS domain S-box-containing protein
MWGEILTNYSALATAIGTGLAALIFIYKKVVQPMWQAFKNYTDMSNKIDKIFTEITPNGGTSIKDKVDKIDKDLVLVRERQRALMADDKDAMFETDLNGNCNWVNRTYTRLVQRNPSELMGHGWVNAIAQEDRDAIVQGWYKSVKEDREFTGDFKFLTPEGTLIPCQIRSYRMADSHGRAIAYQGRISTLG